MKRFEYLRKLSLEDFADVMLYGYDCKNCTEFRECGCSDYKDESVEGCKKHVIDWLNQEVTDADCK